jgi:hypothetical protein
MKSKKRIGEEEILNLKEKLIIIIIPAILIFLILASFIKTVDNEEYYEKYLIEEVFSGRIIRKFYDQKNHGVETIIYKDLNGQETKLKRNDWIEMWINCNLGDSIFKKKGERSLHVYRARELDTINLNYNKRNEQIFFKYRFDK